MTNTDAVRLIADNLAALTHPGDGKPIIIPLPMFRSSGIPADQAEQFAKDAGLPHADLTTLVAESVVHLLETNGKRIVDDSDLAQLTAAASDHEHERHRDVRFFCRCNAPLFSGVVEDFATDRAKISPEVIRALQQLSPECALAHAVVAS